MTKVPCYYIITRHWEYGVWFVSRIYRLISLTPGMAKGCIPNPPLELKSPNQILLLDLVMILIN